MKIHRFDRSTMCIPEEAGVFWAKAKDVLGNVVVVASSYSSNVRRAIDTADKQSWFVTNVSEFYVEVLLDNEIKLSA
jgi:hypothetical protein